MDTSPVAYTEIVNVDPDKLESWMLVLDAEGIEYRVVRRPTGWTIAVAHDHLGRAMEALSDYEQENPPERTGEPETAEYGRSYAGVFAAAAIAVFYGVTGSADASSPWFVSGTAVSELIRSGEPWRAVTALTLHADLPHILSNTFSTALFVSAVCYVLGPGLGLMLVVLSGVGGNFLNAFFQGAGHRSVGFSTAIFGAVGILAGVQLARHRRVGALRRSWAPLVAGVALLGLLGTGESTDISAHLFGFLAGGLLGLAAGYAPRALPDRAAQAALAAGAAMLVIGSWYLALR